MKKTNTDKTPYLILLIFTIFIIGIIYLVLPSPAFPDLSNSAQSDEPGDTWQNPDQKGFFTNMERNRVLTDIQSKFVIKFGGVTLPSFRSGSVAELLPGGNYLPFSRINICQWLGADKVSQN
ncbi:MAG: hypothetical protein UW88_C0002G0027 [Candidatus Collierbacteria bacterium GW2011_GWD2_45_10]|nr:MAG: hypothetical protein UW88_C0002G0027 [Candidatus Collierbacteria bacterium GW2011_GWD2_45_10]